MTPARDGNAGDAATGHHLLVSDARKNYGPVAALAGVHFEAQPGEFLVLLGPSGSGKSTLIRSLAGVETLDSGQIALSGRTVSDGRRQVASEHRDLAMVFQDYALWPHLNVAGNVGYALRRRGACGGGILPPNVTGASGRHWNGSGWAITCTAIPTNSPAVSNNGSGWPGRSWPNRGCCCSTSRCPTSMPTFGSGSG